MIVYIYKNEEERKKFSEEWFAQKHAEDPERYPTPEERAERERRKLEKFQADMLTGSQNPYELDVGPATLIYIVVMVGSLIFREFYYIWIIASWWYWKRFF
jgi:hypothetical protein